MSALDSLVCLVIKSVHTCCIVHVALTVHISLNLGGLDHLLHLLLLVNEGFLLLSDLLDLCYFS